MLLVSHLEISPQPEKDALLFKLIAIKVIADFTSQNQLFTINHPSESQC